MNNFDARRSRRYVIKHNRGGERLDAFAHRINLRRELRVIKHRLRLRIADNVNHFFGLEQRVDRPGQRAEFEAGEVSNDVLRAVRQEQAHHVALPDRVRREQCRRAIHRRVELSISETPSVALRDEKDFFRRGGSTRFQQFTEVAHHAFLIFYRFWLFTGTRCDIFAAAVRQQRMCRK